MRIWAKVITDHRIVSETVQEFAPARPVDSAGWATVFVELVKPLDLAVPVILPKHVNDLAHFSRAVFKPSDFMESVSYDRFEVEVLPEKKRQSQTEYVFD